MSESPGFLMPLASIHPITFTNCLLAVVFMVQSVHSCSCAPMLKAETVCCNARITEGNLRRKL